MKKKTDMNFKEPTVSLEEKMRLYEENIKKATELYTGNKEEGYVLVSILGPLKESHKDVYNLLKKELLSLDPTVFKKNNFIQKIILNRILITLILKSKAKENNEINTINVLSLLSYDLKDDIWLETVMNYVLPYIIKLDILKEG